MLLFSALYTDYAYSDKVIFFCISQTEAYSNRQNVKLLAYFINTFLFQMLIENNSKYNYVYV